MTPEAAGAYRLTRVRLRRFRCHEALDWAGDGRPVAIYGRNGAGKTAILEAISLLGVSRGLRGAGVEEMAQRPDPIGWSASAEAMGPEGSARLAVSVDLRDGARRRRLVDDEAAPAAALSARLRQLWLTPAMDRLWMDGASERRRFLDRITLVFFPNHGEQAAAYERAMRERNKLLKEPGGAPGAWFDALERRMADAGAAVADARRATTGRLETAQAAAASAFPKARLTLEEDWTDGANALAAALGAGRGRDAAAGRALAGPHRTDLAAVFDGPGGSKGAPARLCSTGEQKALLITLVLAAARGLAAEHGAAPILLLDEIAAHLDPDRRRALWDEVSALGAQAWMTGAEVDLFTDLCDRAEYLPL